MPVTRLIGRVALFGAACGGMLLGASAAAQAATPATAPVAVHVQLPHAGGLPTHWRHHDQGFGFWSDDDNQCDDNDWDDDDCDCGDWD